MSTTLFCLLVMAPPSSPLLVGINAATAAAVGNGSSHHNKHKKLFCVAKNLCSADSLLW